MVRNTAQCACERLELSSEHGVVCLTMNRPKQRSCICCGQGAARITEVLPAATIIKEMIESATEILSRELPTRVSFG